MGATSTNRPEGMTTLDFFKSEFPITLTKQGQVLASAVVKTGESAKYGGWPEVFYAAVKGSPDGPDHVWALVVLFVRNGNRDGYNITYREMDENAGPSEESCPARILDLLSPTDHPYALDWRARCRAFNQRLDKVKALKVGDTITLDKPIEFQNGVELTHMTLVDKKKSLWRSSDAYGLYRLRPTDLPQSFSTEQEKQ